jgi:hypothetical protein
MLVIALPQPPRGNEMNIGTRARPTGYTIRPSVSNNVPQAVIGVGEVFDCLPQHFGFDIIVHAEVSSGNSF